MAETKKDALAALDAFVETWGVKYDKAVECLIKDREALLAFYDFPAEHWKHLRTTNVIESRSRPLRMSLVSRRRLPKSMARGRVIWGLCRFDGTRPGDVIGRCSAQDRAKQASTAE
jgi:transposase-like protein